MSMERSNADRKKTWPNTSEPKYNNNTTIIIIIIIIQNTKYNKKYGNI